MTEQTKKIIDITRPDDRQTDELVCLWQASVRATHHFLSERDILALESEVRSALAQIPELYAFSERGKFSDLSALPTVRPKCCSFRRTVSAGESVPNC